MGHLILMRQPHRECPSTMIKTDYINEGFFFDEAGRPLFDENDFPLPITDPSVMTASHLVLDAGGNIVVNPDSWACRTCRASCRASIWSKRSS